MRRGPTAATRPGTGTVYNFRGRGLRLAVGTLNSNVKPHGIPARGRAATNTTACAPRSPCCSQALRITATVAVCGMPRGWRMPHTLGAATGHSFIPGCSRPCASAARQPSARASAVNQKQFVGAPFGLTFGSRRGPTAAPGPASSGHIIASRAWRPRRPRLTSNVRPHGTPHARRAAIAPAHAHQIVLLLPTPA